MTQSECQLVLEPHKIWPLWHGLHVGDGFFAKALPLADFLFQSGHDFIFSVYGKTTADALGGNKNLLLPAGVCNERNFLRAVDKLHGYQGQALFPILENLLGVLTCAPVAPNGMSQSSFLRMFCSSLWKRLFWSFRNVVSSLPSFSTSRQQGTMESISDVAGTLATIAGELKLVVKFHFNGASKMCRWGRLGFSGLFILLDKLCDQEEVLPRPLYPCSLPHELHSFVAFWEIACPVLLWENLQNEMLFHHFLDPCGNLAG